MNIRLVKFSNGIGIVSLSNIPFDLIVQLTECTKTDSSNAKKGQESFFMQ